VLGESKADGLKVAVLPVCNKPAICEVPFKVKED
jgi:hypothetical protein